MPSGLNKSEVFKLWACGNLVAAIAHLAFVYVYSSLRTAVSSAAGISLRAASDDIGEITSIALPNRIQALIKGAERIQADDRFLFQNVSELVDFDGKFRFVTLNGRSAKTKSCLLAGLTFHSADLKQLRPHYSKRSDFISAPYDTPTESVMQNNFASSIAGNIYNASIAASNREAKNSSGSFIGTGEVHAAHTEDCRHITVTLRRRSVDFAIYLSFLAFLPIALMSHRVLVR